MAHGWEETFRTREVSRRKCTCGQGEIIRKCHLEESDYSSEEREVDYFEITICDNCNPTNKK